MNDVLSVFHSPPCAFLDATGAIVCGLCIVVSATVAFFAGLHYARTAMRRSIERAKKNLSTLFSHVSESIDNAQQACRVLEEYPRLNLSLDQLRSLEQKQSSLLETVGRIVDSQFETTELPPIETEPNSPPPAIDWVLAPEDGVTKLPARAAFDANLEILLAASAEHDYASGLLLIKLDKVEALKQRFGIAGVQEFTRQFAGRICRSMTDVDVACQLGADLFAVLMPNVGAKQGRKNATAIRDAIRRHHFRPSEDGPEVLVTASLGFTPFRSSDAAESILNRCRHALSRSEKRGRNQLHVDDGSKLTLCPA